MPSASSPRRVTQAWVQSRRFATQRLSSTPLPSATEAVRLLTCVQSQDAPLAHWSLGMRIKDESYAGSLAEQATGTFVRTHVLRPTWHFVAAEDLRWIQSLTSAKVLSSMAGRHRGLGLTSAVTDSAMAALCEMLKDRNALTRKQITAEFAERGLPSQGEQMAHQLITAEMHSVICSGPPAGAGGKSSGSPGARSGGLSRSSGSAGPTPSAEHTYVLVDEVIPLGPFDSLPETDRPAAIGELTHRFVAGHGPVDDRDLNRWCTLTLTEIRAALTELTDAGTLDTVVLDGRTLWLDPATAARTTRAATAYLLSTFDEVTLTYPSDGPRRATPDHDRTRLLSEAGGGTTLVDGIDIGVWKRKVVKGAVEVRVLPEIDLTRAQKSAIEEAAARLGNFLGLEPRLTFS